LDENRKQRLVSMDLGLLGRATIIPS